MNEYVPIFLEWLDVTQDLSAEEKGRLIDAVVTYAAGGDYESLLCGPEKIAFRFLKGQVDRNKAIAEKRANAGSNKTKPAQTNDNKQEQTETNDNKPEQTETNLLKEKEKEKEKDKEKEKNKEEQRAREKAFDSFWAAYPRKEAKSVAKAAFLKIGPDADLLEKMLSAVEAWKKSDQWTRDGGQYIPHPATWLNQRRWEDEPPKPAHPGARAPVKQVIDAAFEQRENTEHDMNDVPDWLMDIAEG